MMRCSVCDKVGEVGFRVSVRNPEKIYRATLDTLKPLCFRCAEKHRAEVLAEKARKKAIVPVPPEPEAPVSLGSKTEVKLYWRWWAYSILWKKAKPTRPGGYWVWSEKMDKPVFWNVAVGQEFKDEELWFLGPIKMPPAPDKAVRYYKNKPVKKTQPSQPEAQPIGPQKRHTKSRRVIAKEAGIVKNMLIQLVRNGEVRIGMKIPSMRLLVKDLNVSMGSIKRAVAELIRMKILVSEPGDGIYVAAIAKPESEAVAKPDAVDGKPMETKSPETKSPDVQPVL